MITTELIKLVGNLTDESLPSATILNFINDAIAKINIEASAEFPFIPPADIGLSYIPLSETYQRTLLATFASAMVKYADASTVEGDTWMLKFEDNLQKFVSSYTIPTEYASTTVGYIENDFEDCPYRGGW